MEFKNYYKALDVEKDASQDEIKRSFRKLARKYHPDINKESGAEDRFKEINEAYEVLGDTEKRAAYDQLGQQYKPGQDFRPEPNWDAGFEFSEAQGGAGEGGYSDFFESFFRGMHRQQSQARSHEFHARGEDHHAKVVIDLQQSFSGATLPITLNAPEIDAQGHVTLKPRTLNVQIPRGVTEGQTVRLKGQGGPGTGSLPAGDLYLEVHFRPHPLYRVDGRNLRYDLPIAPWEATLGASVQVPTPTGDIVLKIPQGSFQGRELRIKGRGLPAAEPGDLYVTLKIVLPPADTPEAKKAYEDMATKLAFDPRANFKG
jgi:curved DNA-binding protein